MNVAITGVTGLIGRHLFYEIIRFHLSHLDELHFFLFGRGSSRSTFQERVIANFCEDGFSYLQKPQDDATLLAFLHHQVHYIEMDLGAEELFPVMSQKVETQQTSFDLFFHLAALPDLRSLPTTEAKVMELNYQATRRLVQFLANVEVKKFCYVGTAFVCGKKAGHIFPDSINEDHAYNNPYERSKMLAELAVRDFALQTNTNCLYFRPGIVCGRLMEAPLGHTHKFDVFYQIFSFFLFLKALKLKTLDGLLETQVDLDIRVVFDPASSANIVPVDYLVKVMHQACIQNLNEKSFHLVNEQNIALGDFLHTAMRTMNISGVHSVRMMPDNPSLFEQMYADRVGKLFDSYLNTEPKLFDTSNLKPILQQTGLQCPVIEEKNVDTLIRYALSKHFGLNLSRLLQQFVQ